jgi:phospho-N-acetylmuramoyl-pentapeptide-transferase
MVFEERSLIIWLMMAFGVSVLVYPAFIRLLRRLQFGQNILVDGPKAHQAKAGTPNIGGVVFMLVWAVASLLYSHSIIVMLVVGICLSYAAIGFVDDYCNKAKIGQGLRAWHKFGCQVVLGGVFAYLVQHNLQLEYAMYFPFCADSSLVMSEWLWYPLVVLVFAATTNATNLTDGIDGLAGNIVIAILVAFAGTLLVFSDIFSSVSGLDLESMRLLIVECGLLIATLAGFLWHNTNKAAIFMGDCGSLALGAFLASITVLTGTYYLLIIYGIILVLEASSVICQVGYFKLTNGKRIFKMAPFHHHLELSGWTNGQIVTRLVLVTWVAIGVGVLGVK